MLVIYAPPVINLLLASLAMNCSARRVCSTMKTMATTVTIIHVVMYVVELYQTPVIVLRLDSMQMAALVVVL